MSERTILAIALVAVVAAALIVSIAARRAQRRNVPPPAVGATLTSAAPATASLADVVSIELWRQTHATSARRRRRDVAVALLIGTVTLLCTSSFASAASP